MSHRRNSTRTCPLGQVLHAAGHQGLRAGHFPVLEVGRGGDGGAGLDERRAVDQPEQSAAREVGADHASNVMPQAGPMRRPAPFRSGTAIGIGSESGLG